MLPRCCAAWFLIGDTASGIYSIVGCFLHKASLPCRGTRLPREKHGGISGHGGQPLCSWWASAAPAWLLPLLLLARPTSAPFPQGNCLFLLTCPQMASLVFPLLGKKLRGCTKFPYCNKNLGAPLGRTPQWRVGKRGNILRKEHLRVFLQKTENILLLKPCAQNLASSEIGNCLTATYANSLDEFHSLKCELE